MDVTDVLFYEQPKDEVGLPPKIAMPIDRNNVTVQLIVESKGGNSVICGYILKPEREQPTACRFNNPIKLDDNVNMSDVHVAIEQVSGHPSNDGKMISICTGQCATRCKCFCSACLITLDQLNQLPEWIQRRTKESWLQKNLREGKGKKCVQVSKVKIPPVDKTSKTKYCTERKILVDLTSTKPDPSLRVGKN